MIKGKRRVIIECGDDGRTKQAFKDECNINKIVEKARMSGFLASRNYREPFYGDVSQVPDYRQALEIVSYAQNAFMSMPAELRSKFDNDPAKMLDFITDDRNYDKAVEYGFIKKPEGNTISDKGGKVVTTSLPLEKPEKEPDAK